MNQKEIWCVVNPSIGLPMFLGAVAVTSLIVHGAVLTNTDWYPAYFNGSYAAAVSAAPANAADSAAPLASASGLPATLVADVAQQTTAAK